jgi:Holliday junction DNA helicase RuvA|tara:strand:- start:7733 stop:8362 length:630 start_codon:yes stop_codon:yes gene_type:complete
LITKLTGQLLAIQETTASIGIDPFEYEVAVPDFTRRHLQLSVGEKVSLYTIQYIDGNPQKGGRMTPRLIGFNSQIERQFFELFCSVPGLGVKKALKAMVRPVQDIAKSIEEQDVKSLTTLPGIGPAMAEKIVAQLRRKMAKFALLVQQAPTKSENDVERSIVDETFQVLMALGHNEFDARKLLEEPLAGKQNFKDVEALLQAVYEQANR